MLLTCLLGFGVIHRDDLRKERFLLVCKGLEQLVAALFVSLAYTRQRGAKPRVRLDPRLYYSSALLRCDEPTYVAPRPLL